MPLTLGLGVRRALHFAQAACFAASWPFSAFEGRQRVLTGRRRAKLVFLSRAKSFRKPMQGESVVVNREFIDDLASSAPTPGGGGAAAYCGALASALASMVAGLTVGKKKYAAVEADMLVMLEKLSDLRERLMELIDEDAEAFGPLAAAYRMPKGTPEELQAKEDALQAALVGACEVPMEIMRSCCQVIEQCEFLAANGSRLVLSDAGVAALFANAALQGASLSVYANVVSMSDRDRAAAFESEAAMLAEVWGDRAKAAYERVLHTINAR